MADAIHPELRDLIRICEGRLRQNPEDPDALFTKAAVLAGIGFHADALACIRIVSAQVEDYPGLGHFRYRVLAGIGHSKASSAGRS